MIQQLQEVLGNRAAMEKRFIGWMPVWLLFSLNCLNIKCSLIYASPLPQVLTRIPLSSARTCRQPHRKRGRMGSWRNRRCWCSTWETPKPSPYKWKERSLSLTPCSTGKPLQVESNIRQSAPFSSVSDFSHFTAKVFGSSGPGGCAVLCDSMWVQRCQFHHWGEEDVASGLVNWCCH